MSSVFDSTHYRHHNQCRLSHLDSLDIPIKNRTVLEVGAGTGDLTSYFVERNCRVTSLEGRQENILELRSKHPTVEAIEADLEKEDFASELDSHYDILFCYGTLYHLANPANLLERLCPLVDLCLLETCVSPAKDELVHPCDEDLLQASQSLSGMGCRPSRYWVYHHLQKYFSHVYTCYKQPQHPEFPIDWLAVPPASGLTRSVFVASNHKLASTQLYPGLIQKHDI